MNLDPRRCSLLAGSIILAFTSVAVARSEKPFIPAQWPDRCISEKVHETQQDRHWYASDKIYHYVAMRDVPELRKLLKPNSLKNKIPGPVQYLVVAAGPSKPRFGDPIDQQEQNRVQARWGGIVIDLLLKAGADPNDGNPLITASYAAPRMKGYAGKIVSQFLNAGSDPNRRNNNGWTALMFAADNGSTDIARQLLAHGARTDYRNCAGQTAADIAKARGHAPLVKLLRPR